MADIIDLEQLNDVTGGDEEFAAELLEEYTNLLCDELSKLSRATESGNLEEARFVAHAIKGASASLGVEPIATAAARMEDYARDGDLPASQATLVEIERQVSRYLNWFESPRRAA